MRRLPLFLLAWVVAGCGARTGLPDLQSSQVTDASTQDASVHDASSDAGHVIDAQQDPVVDVVAEHEPTNCTLLQLRGPIQLGTGSQSSSIFPSTVWTGQGWAVAWLEGNEDPGESPSTYFAFVRDGEVVAGPKEILKDNSHGPGPAWNGSELVFCWPSGGNTVISRVDVNGERVAPDTVLLGGKAVGCTLRRVEDRLLALMSGAGDQRDLAWLTLQGQLVEGPTTVVEATAYPATVSLAVADDGVLMSWDTKDAQPTDLVVQLFDNHFSASGAAVHPVSTLKRPTHPVLRRNNDNFLLAACSDMDDAPAQSWSVWTQPLTSQGQPVGPLVHVIDTMEWERPAMLGLGDAWVIGTVSVSTRQPALNVFLPDGTFQGTAQLHDLPKGPTSDLQLATGPYWGDIGLVFDAYAGQARQEVFFVNLACGE